MVLRPRACAPLQTVAVGTTTPIIVVLIHGGPLDVSWFEESDRVDAILTAWFPGQVSAVGSGAVRYVQYMHVLSRLPCIAASAAP